MARKKKTLKWPEKYGKVENYEVHPLCSYSEYQSKLATILEDPRCRTTGYMVRSSFFYTHGGPEFLEEIIIDARVMPQVEDLSEDLQRMTQSRTVEISTSHVSRLMKQLKNDCQREPVYIDVWTEETPIIDKAGEEYNILLNRGNHRQYSSIGLGDEGSNIQGLQPYELRAHLTPHKPSVIPSLQTRENNTQVTSLNNTVHCNVNSLTQAISNGSVTNPSHPEVLFSDLPLKQKYEAIKEWAFNTGLQQDRIEKLVNSYKGTRHKVDPGTHNTGSLAKSIDLSPTMVLDCLRKSGICGGIFADLNKTTNSSSASSAGVSLLCTSDLTSDGSKLATVAKWTGLAPDRLAREYEDKINTQVLRFRTSSDFGSDDATKSRIGEVIKETSEINAAAQGMKHQPIDLLVIPEWRRAHYAHGNKPKFEYGDTSAIYMIVAFTRDGSWDVVYAKEKPKTGGE